MNVYSKFFFLFSLLFSFYLSSSAQIIKKSNEKNLFFFKTKKGKWVSLCMDKQEKYMVFRMGTSTQLEMEYPEKKDTSSFSKFTYNTYFRGGGFENAGLDLNYITFDIKDIRYIIYDLYSAEGPDYSIGIRYMKLSDRTILKDIEGINKTRKGHLDVFRNQEWVKTGEGTYD